MDVDRVWRLSIHEHRAPTKQGFFDEIAWKSIQPTPGTRTSCPEKYLDFVRLSPASSLADVAQYDIHGGVII